MSSATVKPYPHYKIDVEDRSIYEPIEVEQLPLCRQLYIMKAEKGPIGEPIWCDTWSKASRIFGKETFNMNNKEYFSQASYFLNQTFTHNGAFVVRVADDDADTAMMLIEAKVWNELVAQYQKDEFGNYLLDGAGDPIPLLGSDLQPVIEPGLRIEWMTRSSYLNAQEKENGPDRLQPRTVVEAGVTKTIYPMFVLTSTTAGAWGNATGISLYWDTRANDADQVDRVGSTFYTMAPVARPYGESASEPVRDIYSNTFNPFSVKPDAMDPASEMRVSIAAVLERYRNDNVIPFQIVTYSDSFEHIGNRVMDVEANRSNPMDPGYIASPWHVNLISCYDIDNKPYDHFKLVTSDESVDAKNFHRAVIHYLDSGADGDLSDTTIEALYRQFLGLAINPDIVDRPRYPFTHLFDVGYSLQTKYAMLDFLNTRDDVKIYVATQVTTDVMGAPKFNSKMEDESIASVLRARALLMRESIVKGTECCRATIFSQSGIPHGNYTKIMPTTLWAAMKHAEYHNRDFLGREPKGLPFSDIRLFKEINWVPSDEDTKARSWDTGMNYFQHYNMRSYHYASIRSVYRYETSVLVDDSFTDAIVYSKHEVRQSWAVFAGVILDAPILQERIRRDMEARLDRLFNKKYRFRVFVYQTEEDVKLGFIHHVLIEITSPATNRVWQVDIVCKRDGYEPDAALYGADPTAGL